jgi:hypothetical protein
MHTAQVVRMDQTGHTIVADWRAEDDPATVEVAAKAFRTELEHGYFAVVSRAEGRADVTIQVRRQTSLRKFTIRC